MRNTQDLIQVIFSNLETVEEDYIRELLGVLENTSLLHYKPLFETVLKFKEAHNKFPSFEYLYQMYQGYLIPSQEKLNSDLLSDLMYQMKKEYIAIKAHFELSQGNLDSAKEILSDFGQQNKPLNLFSIDDVLPSYERMKTIPSGVLCGVKSLDDIYLGFGYQAAHVIAAPPGQGKTTFLLNLLYNAIMHSGFKAVLFTLEVSSRNVFYNLLCRHSFEIGLPIDSKYLKKGNLNDPKHLGEKGEKRFKLVVESWKESIKGKIEIISPENMAEFNPVQIIKTLDVISEKFEGGIDIVGLDYLNLTKFYNTPGIRNSYDQQNFYMRFFTNLSVTYGNFGFICFVLSQVNRVGMDLLRRNKGIGLDVLAEANELERSATTVTVLTTTADDLAAKKLNIQTLKNRDGGLSVNIIPSRIEPQYCFIGNLEINKIATPGEASELLEKGKESETQDKDMA